MTHACLFLAGGSFWNTQLDSIWNTDSKILCSGGTQKVYYVCVDPSLNFTLGLGWLAKGIRRLPSLKFNPPTIHMFASLLPPVDFTLRVVTKGMLSEKVPFASKLDPRAAHQRYATMERFLPSLNFALGGGYKSRLRCNISHRNHISQAVQQLQSFKTWKTTNWHDHN